MPRSAILLAALVAAIGLSSSSAVPADAQSSSKKDAKKAEKPGKTAKKGAEEPPGARAPAEWWNRSYAGRRRVLFDREPAAGEPVLLITGTAGMTRPDLRDLRVVADGQAALPCEVLEAGPGDRVALAFESPGPGHDLRLYLGFPFADPPRRPAKELKGGLRLEVRALPEGPASSLAEMTKLLKAAGEPLGVLFPESIGLGVHPLGRREYLARYVGWLRVEKPGEHLLETASEGPSFALIDGKPVASWPGFHDLAGYADAKARKEHSGAAVLAPGIHSLEVLVATRRGGVHALGLRGPSDAFPRPIPPDRLVRWAAARAGPLEARGETAADFSFRTVSDSGGDAEGHELALVELAWSADLAGRVLGEVEWDFGDGQRGHGESVRHVYLGHGVFPVTARARAGVGKTLEALRRVPVRFESLAPGDLNRLLEEYHGLVKGYDLDRLPEDHLARFVWLARKDFRWEEDLFRAVEAWYARGLPLARDEIAGDGLLRARRLVEAREGFDRARAILERVAREAPRPEDRQEGAAWLAAARLLSPGAAGEEAAAVEELRKVLEAGAAGGSDAGRRAGIFLGAHLLGEGKREEAEGLLRKMEDGPFRRVQGERQVASGAHALAFDALLRRGDLREARDELERWEWELPADRLAGHLGLRRGALLRKEGKLDAALLELRGVEALGRPEDGGAANAVPRALLLEAEVLDDKGDAGGARKARERIVREFPGRPERREAEERLAGKPMP